MDTCTTTHVAFLLDDDSQSTPLWLYVGVKSTAIGANFIERNGLKGGQLYAWKADNVLNVAQLTPQQFNAIYAGVHVGSTTYAQGNRNPFIDFPQFADVIFLGTNTTSFLKWQYQRFTLAQLAVETTSGMTADPDGDGRSNWAEFLFNGNPLSGSDTPLSLSTADNQVTITFYRPKGTLPVTANVQTTTTLGAANFVNVVNWQAAATVTDLGEYERVAYTTTLNPAEPTRFWRVKFE